MTTARLPFRLAFTQIGGAILGAALIFLAGAGPAAAGPALVFDARSGEVLHAHEPFTPWYPASLTKLMTAYVTMHAVRRGRVGLDSPVRVSALARSQPPSRMGFPVGTEISVEHALRIIIVRSANDISVALGEAVAGDLQSFINEMNRAAARLGMSDSHFVNPHGLPDERQVTTARDMALLAWALIREFPEYQYLFETQSIRVQGNVLNNHNRLLGRLPGADGLKTGYTCSSGFNLAASATRNGRRIVSIVLGGVTAQHRNEVSAGLLEDGFQRTGGTFRLFGGGGPRLNSLRRPAGAAAQPVDLRPYVCQGRAMPEQLASFGTVATGASAATAHAAAGVGDAATAALIEAPVVSLQGQAERRDPVSAFQVPLPRPRPMRGPAAGGARLDLGNAARQSGNTRLPAPAPAPLRSPVR